MIKRVLGLSVAVQRLALHDGQDEAAHDADAEELLGGREERGRGLCRGRTNVGVVAILNGVAGTAVTSN